jgi:ubiquinone biosynthesis protein COQ9
MSNLQRERDALLLVTLSNVVFDGWTDKALKAGAKSLGLNAGDVRELFPKGPLDLAKHYSDYADRQMLLGLMEAGISDLPVRERIAAAIRIRLEQNAPHREAIRKMMTFLSLPGRAGVAAKLTYETVNTMWYAAGDNATDFNFYTKRALLTGVYMSAILYWLADESEGAEDTWAFVDRRIRDVMVIPKVQKRLGRILPSLSGLGRLAAGRAGRP